MDPLLVTVLILAALQGVTEFLPISSSGHLVIAAALLAPHGDPRELEIVDLNIVLHAGTLGSIFVFYGWRLWQLIAEDRRAIGLLVVGSLPAAAIGIPLKLFAAGVLEQPLLAGVGLLATGGVLLWAGRLSPGERDYRELSFLEALGIGAAQGIAILPGVSRSGSTISAGLGLGLSPQSAATFSFLLAVPAIGGACLLELKDLIKDRDNQAAASAPVKEVAAQSTPTTQASHPPLPREYLALGALLAFAVGLASLWALTHLLESGRFALFAWWCIPVGVAVLVWKWPWPA